MEGEESGEWQRFSEETFHRFLDDARRLDPQNLDAFVVAVKYLIIRGGNIPALALIDFRETQCRRGEWLCHEACGYLRAMAVRRAAADAPT